MNSTLRRLLSLLIILSVPFFLILTAVRAMFTPASIQIEYTSPGFPPDPFGFTLQDRLYWSRISLDYLLNNSDISFLADQHLPDGSPLYSDRELSHMVDVKNLFQKSFLVHDILAILLIGLGTWAWQGHWMPDFWRALSNGGKLTLGVVALVLVGVLLSFRDLFTYFHEIFFTGNSWLFYTSDTLIRLFPLRLWQDVFIFGGAVTLLGAILLIIIGIKWGKPRSSTQA